MIDVVITVKRRFYEYHPIVTYGSDWKIWVDQSTKADMDSLANKQE